ncbi:hypothetical protein C3486_21255 [Streptomyces sp. Ru73]|uniref:ImmA/IrrE family metallo-endopeptidase n=1 Tax=Streptomyces sp. Ru73 TaxID=2080748 RepID=UPI000CDDECAD|nr:ImmA/IrrE family metallo-endopeptidase [Streptomyces sp. Ru73]POX38810.1 hypothetical protein C3486_21255 [Streptomyces sp. Ru73]
MRFGRERRRALRRIRRLRLPGTPTLQDVVDAVAATRSRPISITTRRLPLPVSGICARLEKQDVIVVDGSAPQLSQVLAVCHELAHLLCGHTPTQDSLLDDATVSTLLPGVRPDVARAVLLGRTRYGAPLEREAEFLATRLVTLLDLRREHTGTTQISAALAHRRQGG